MMQCYRAMLLLQGELLQCYECTVPVLRFQNVGEWKRTVSGIAFDTFSSKASHIWQFIVAILDAHLCFGVYQMP